VGKTQVKFKIIMITFSFLY